MSRTGLMRSASRMGLLVLWLLLGVAIGCADDGSNGAPGPQGPQGPEGPEGPQGPPGSPTEPTTALEACIGCHAPNGVRPVGDVTDPLDLHYIDGFPTQPPLIANMYRELQVDITEVDVTGNSVVIEFDASDENSNPVGNLFASDGRFTIARLNPPPTLNAPTTWESLILRTEDPGGVGDGPGTPEQQGTAENFSSGTFEVGPMGGLAVGSYRYTSSYDPSADVMDGDTVRVAIQISAGDLPAGNGWCDFDADTVSPNSCEDPGTLTLHRDIVQTATCNGCHGVTSDTRLALHGGGRTDVQYCVTCHNPSSKDANSGNSVSMPVLIHKLHRGSSLANGYKIWGFRDNLHDYSTVSFTKDIDNCAVCHTGGGADVDNWSTVPSREACGTCHDDVNFATGANHGSGGVQTSDTFCVNCHPQNGPRTAAIRPIETVHLGAARIAEGGQYRGGSNGYAIDDVSRSGNSLVVTYSVTRGGGAMDLDTDPQWTAGGGASRLALIVAWLTEPDYTNEDSGSDPGLPISVNALDVGGVVTDNMDGTYTTTVPLPSAARSGTVTAALEGHPAADLDGDTVYSDRIAVKNAFAHFDFVQQRTMTLARRSVIDIDKCNQCHDAAGNGLSLHGNNRTGQDQVCVMCHNGNATDINRRPAPPAMTADGKLEEAIHFRRMIHQIHSGAELENGIVVYGFGGSVNDFSHVEFIGNRQNCETCHKPGTYSMVNALEGIATTIDTGADKSDPDDDLNISQAAAVCSGCHDGAEALDHMKLNGASFQALDENIHYQGD